MLKPVVTGKYVKISHGEINNVYQAIHLVSLSAPGPEVAIRKARSTVQKVTSHSDMFA